MLKNYITTALRAPLKNKLYAFINIFGLAMGLAAALLIAWITAAGHAARVARANPVHALRCE